MKVVFAQEPCQGLSDCPVVFDEVLIISYMAEEHTDSMHHAERLPGEDGIVTSHP
jgi:hypothetical protein